MTDDFDHWMRRAFHSGEPRITAEQARRLAVHLLRLAGAAGEAGLSEEAIAEIRERIKHGWPVTHPVYDDVELLLDDRDTLTADLALCRALISDLRSPDNAESLAAGEYARGVGKAHHLIEEHITHLRKESEGFALSPESRYMLHDRIETLEIMKDILECEMEVKPNE